MARVRFEYGRTGLPVELPDHLDIRHLAYKAATPLADPGTVLQNVLETPAGCPPLLEVAKGRKDACILICDITRPVPNQLILSRVLATLQQAGVPRDRILLLVATGLHRENDQAELVEMVGQEIFDGYRIEQHHGQNIDEHSYLGDSPRGVPIWIDQRYVDADLKITTGLIEPHLMAGYSGGRKLICPGIAALESVRVWHGPKFLEHPNADCGILQDNPVHEESTWIARKAGCDFIVNVVIDSERRPLKFVAGDMEQAFLEGVSFVRDIVTDTVPEPVDIVVTSAAGYPLDTTFYQAVKGMTGALPIVRSGGTIIIAAGMTDGIGSPQFEQLFEENESAEAFMQKILGGDYFMMDQWQLEEMAKVLRKASITVVTDGLPETTLKKMFVDTAPSVEAAISDALTKHGPNASMAVIPKGPYVLAQVA